MNVYKFGILKCLPSPPASATVNIHNGFFRNAELEHLRQLNTDLHESCKCTVPIKCISDILASRGTHFLCSFTSPLSPHLRFNYLPSSHLRMCRLPFTMLQALHVGGTNLFIKKKKMWTNHFDCILCAFDKAKRMPTVFQEDQCLWNKICCLVYRSTSISLRLSVMCQMHKRTDLKNHQRLLEWEGTL